MSIPAHIDDENLGPGKLGFKKFWGSAIGLEFILMFLGTALIYGKSIIELQRRIFNAQNAKEQKEEGNIKDKDRGKEKKSTSPDL